MKASAQIAIIKKSLFASELYDEAGYKKERKKKDKNFLLLHFANNIERERVSKIRKH
jgi:hypothetical protein